MTQEADVLASFDGLYAAACEARDADAVVGLFVTDEDLSFWGSDQAEQYLGPAELRTFADAVTRFDGSLRFAWRARRVRVEGDAAWVNALGEVAIETGESVRLLPYRVTGVLLRRDGRWLWHTHHGSEPGAE